MSSFSESARKSSPSKTGKSSHGRARKKLLLFLLLSCVALMTLLSVFKREVTFIKSRNEIGLPGGKRPGSGKLDKHAVEEALRRQHDEEASLIFLPDEAWAGGIDTGGSSSGSDGSSDREAGTTGKTAINPGPKAPAHENEVPSGKKDSIDGGQNVQSTNKNNGEDGGVSDDDYDYLRGQVAHSDDESLVDVDYEDLDDNRAIDEIDDGLDHSNGDDVDYGAHEDTPSSFETSKPPKSPSITDKPVEVQEALKALKACRSLECIGKAHKKLAGKTKFNAPHYFLIGFQKCATTSVNNYLRGHPEYMPSVLKEAHYFTACAKSWNDTNCKANSTQDYIDNYLRISDAVDNGLMAATVDASVDYAWKGENLAREIYQVFPWLKIVVMMREPISRVISYTRMWTQKGVRTSTHKDNRIACDEGEDLFDCLYPHLTPTAYTGHYAVPLEGWLKVWPADQIHVIQFEEFVSETDAVMRRLKTFLGLDPTLPENQQLYNVNTRKDSGGSPMKRREYRTLIEMARPDSERVADLLQKHGLAEKDAWMRRWEHVWEENLKACGPDRVCMINSN